MSSLAYRFSQEIPLVAEADVVVLGAGPGGLGAAVMAARAGAETLLVERAAGPGGMAWIAEVQPFMSSHVEGRSLDAPVYLEWARRMRDYLPPKFAQERPFDGENRDSCRQMHKDLALLAAEDLLVDAGCGQLYHHTLFDVLGPRGDAVRAGRIEAAVVHAKDGLCAVRGRIFIDATGDADLAFLAGCECESGGPGGHSQPMTLCFKLEGVDEARRASREEINALYDRARREGRLDVPRENVLLFPCLAEGVVHFNTTRILHKSGTDGRDLSAAEIEGRRQVRQLLRFLREEVSGFEQAALRSIAQHVGVRESRRVVGLARLAAGDFHRAARFDDAIARCRYAIDIHNPDGEGTKIVAMPDGDFYEIPYGCIVPRDCANLLVAGRPVSASHEMHASLRIMPTACSIGQAAGMAAAMSVQAGRDPRELDGREVRRRLREAGARL
jgi:hypothetical protein